jgi:hypothetical protein
MNSAPTGHAHFRAAEPGRPEPGLSRYDETRHGIGTAEVPATSRLKLTSPESSVKARCATVPDVPDAKAGALEESGAATGERQPNGEEGVDDHLDVEVDLAQAEERDVDQVGQCPQAIEEDHHQEDVAGP